MEQTQKAMAWLLSGCVRAYQLLLGPWFFGCCRFHPTCSHYALDALAKKAWPCALLLIVNRLLRCHPWAQGGHDPVR